jgi:hypothetical protein
VIYSIALIQDKEACYYHDKNCHDGAILGDKLSDEIPYPDFSTGRFGMW